MGYNVTLTDSSAVLPKENHEEILSRWHEMNDKKYDDIKRGGSYSGGRTLSKHYSWMPEDYHKTTHSPEEVLEHLGFDFSINARGDIVIESYDSKTGQEDLFFKKIADLVEPGSLMQWRGEDGARYGWFFDGAKMQELSVKEALILVSDFDAKPSQPVEQKTEKPKKNSRYQL